MIKKDEDVPIQIIEKKLFEQLKNKATQLNQEYIELCGFNSRLNPFLLYINDLL